MKKESWSVLFACVLGAFIGALSALEISARFAYGEYLWGFGALFGGLIAYLVVDFRKFCSGIANSYHVAASNISSASRSAVGWRPYMPYWRAVSAGMLGCVSLLASSVLLFYVAAISFDVSEKDSVPRYLLSIFGITSAVATCCLISVMLTLPLCLSKMWNSTKPRDAHEVSLSETEQMGWASVKYGNPVALSFFLLHGLASMLCKMCKMCGAMLKWLWQNKTRIRDDTIAVTSFVWREARGFVVRIFVYVHSDRRTLCFVDATLGACAGYFLGSAIIGATIGAVLGVVNYEFVSVRWLKLVPAKAR